MGRRKERRHAAMSATGRRVKLDLFAEPSGDLGASSAHDKVGENGDSENHAGLPNSPSSSGQQPGNPLLLLEQYSDEELDEESNEGRNREVSEDPSVDTDGQTKIAAGKETEDVGNNDGNETSVLVIDHDSTSQNPLEKLGKGSEMTNDSGDLDRGTNPAEVTYPVVSDVQLVGDTSTGWKVVLHEESNQYYYWNITTGETSWEVPDDLAQVTDMSCLEKAASGTEEKSNGLVGTAGSIISLDMEYGDSTTGQLNGGSDANCKTGIFSEQVVKMHGYGEGCNGDSVDKEKGSQDADQNNETSLLADNLLGNEIALSTKINHGTHSEECETGTELPSQLVKHCEILLERLNSAKGLSCHLQACDLISKSALEVEIRLADIKALTNHGSSLLPFWLHSKGQLEQLEAAINDVITQYNSALTSEVEGTNQSLEGIDDAVFSSEKKPLFPVVVPQSSEYAAQDSYFKSYGDGAFTAGHVPSSEHLTAHSGNGSGGFSGLAIHSELTPKTVLHSGEEVDMDVDMEVEDTVASANPPIQDASGAESHLPSEQPNLHYLLGDQEFSVPGLVFSVPPPPPDDDWVPPPPPDDEPFPPPPSDIEPPPPPPDEPPETSAPPPSHLELGQPFTYTEQYNLSYPGSSLEYYGQTNTELSGASLYTNPEGGQVAVSHLPQYYDSVSNVYGAAPLMVNSVEPASYFGHQNGTAHPALSVSGTAVVVESSGIHSDTILKSLGSETAGSSNAYAETGSSLLAQTKSYVLDADQVTDKLPVVPDSQHSIEAPPTASNAKSVCVSSTSSVTATIVAGATSSKGQAKVPRRKKKTATGVSTLRSNKKVSSLVDKWKAAKEELHEEEEEEPENAYEMLEKKRQREIEEWRAQQIASGEAKDNVNFQPLRGDWRERVKRRRSQKLNETENSESDVATEGNQQPDLAALSGGLPSGWQVYWDDSSKQVYYGNTLTSETTWIRPSD